MRNGSFELTYIHDGHNTIPQFYQENVFRGMCIEADGEFFVHTDRASYCRFQRILDSFRVIRMTLFFSEFWEQQSPIRKWKCD